MVIQPLGPQISHGLHAICRGTSVKYAYGLSMTFDCGSHLNSVLGV